MHNFYPQTRPGTLETFDKRHQPDRIKGNIHSACRLPVEDSMTSLQRELAEVSMGIQRTSRYREDSHDEWSLIKHVLIQPIIYIVGVLYGGCTQNIASLSHIAIALRHFQNFFHLEYANTIIYSGDLQKNTTDAIFCASTIMQSLEYIFRTLILFIYSKTIQKCKNLLTKHVICWQIHLFISILLLV
jgi:hypothetical protein